MSAYMLEPASFQKIGAFVNQYTASPRPSDRGLWFYKAGQPYDDNRIDGQDVIDILASQNRRSVNDRYNESEQTPKIKVTSKSPVPPVGELAAILTSLEYQSCETDDYKQTDAYEVLHLVRKLALEVVMLRGHAAAPDQIPEWA